MTNETRITELEEALRTLIAYFWDNREYDEMDAEVLDNAVKTLNAK